MNIIYLSIGSNIGNRQELLARTRKRIMEKIGPISQESSVYETESWGFDGNPFLNQVISVESGLDPKEVLEEIINIEEKFGRKRKGKKYENRIIDIDILFYNDEIVRDARLVVPHKEIENRKFILEPLNEIAPRMIHPVIEKEINTILKECKDQKKVIKI